MGIGKDIKDVGKKIEHGVEHAGKAVEDVGKKVVGDEPKPAQKDDKA
jgi:predicted small secreted protein